MKETLKRYKSRFPPFLGRLGAGIWKSLETPLGALLEHRAILKGHRIVWPVAEVADFESALLLGPTSSDALVQVDFTLISPGTERAQLQGLAGNNFPYHPGYSGCGEVISIGKNITRFRKRDRVAGRIPHKSPATVQEQYLFRIPDNVSLEQAAFIELGIIVLQGIHKAQIQPGESALVLGQGLIGQLTNRLSRLAGAAPIIAVARSRAKEKIAVNAWGADKFLTTDELNEAGPSDGYDVVIETTGDANILPIAAGFARKGGRVIGLGTPRGRGRISLGQNGARPGVRITGAHISGIPQYERSAGLWTYQSEGHLFLDLLARHKLMLDDLISQKVDPAAANGVYESLLSNDPGIIGVLFDWRAYRPQRMKSPFKG